MRTYVPAFCLLVCVMMLAPQVAAGQDRSPTPSADELWRTYPLHETPEPSETLTPTASARPTEAPPAADDDALLLTADVDRLLLEHLGLKIELGRHACLRERWPLR